MAKKTLKSLLEEAKEHGVVIAKEGDYLRLKVRGEIVAWLVPVEDGAWLAQTIKPEITGSWKERAKAGALDWALHHAIEGFGNGYNQNYQAA